MRQYLNISLRAGRRVTCIIASILLSATALPLLISSGSASAQQLQSRGITISDSSASGGTITTGVGSGTNVNYNVSFTTSSAGPTSSMVIDFCSQNPIINDTCSGPTGFDASSATLNATSTSGTVQTTTDNWAITASNSQIKLADDNSTNVVSAHDMQPSTTESFTLSGITNPSAANCPLSDANCTFYARMYTYTLNTYAPAPSVPGGTAYANAASVGTYTDYGGIALSTTNPITVSATVQEQLTFCVTKTDPTSAGSGWTPNPGATSDGCSATNLAYPALTLGHGTPTQILDTTAVDTGNIYTDLSTNAQHGAVINMRSSNLTCTGPGGAGGLTADNGTTCAIPPVNSGAAGTPAPMVPGTAGFGMSCGSYAVSGAGTNGSLTCNAEYNDGTHVPSSTSSPALYYGMQTAAGGAGSVVGPYGSEVASSTGPLYNAFTAYVFGATAALTTPAGIYTADLSLIATGTF
jgi:hypothetical protein